MFYSVISIFVKCIILSSIMNTVDNCYWNNQYLKEELEFVVIFITEYCSAQWFVISGCVWMIFRHYYGLYAIHKQKSAGMIRVHRFKIYWIIIIWMYKDCILWRLIDTWWTKNRKDGRTFSALDSNPFNDVHSMLMLSVIIIMRNEKERIKMGWDWDWLWFKNGFDFCNS